MTAATIPAPRPPVPHLTHVFGRAIDTIGFSGRPGRLVFVHCFACGQMHKHTVKPDAVTVKRRASCRLTRYVIVIGEPS